MAELWTLLLLTIFNLPINTGHQFVIPSIASDVSHRTLITLANQAKSNLPKKPATKRSNKNEAKNDDQSEKTDRSTLIVNGLKVGAGLLLTLILLFSFTGARLQKKEVVVQAKSSIRYIAAKPLIIKHHGIDPATIGQRNLIKVRGEQSGIKTFFANKNNTLGKQLGDMSAKIFPKNQIILDDPISEPEHPESHDNPLSQPIIVPKLIAHHKDLQDKPANESSIAVQAFPHPFKDYFTPNSQENLIWTNHHKNVFGMSAMAITNQRLLNVTQKIVIHILPPGFAKEYIHHEHSLNNLRIINRKLMRRPGVIIVGAPFVVWFPYGTLIAAIFCAIYGIWTYYELAVGLTPEHIRSYKLTGKALDEAARILNKSIKQLALRNRQMTDKSAS